MWGDSWMNLMLKMKDMPYYHYKSSKADKNKDPDAKEGTVDILEEKFRKYLKK